MVLTPSKFYIALRLACFEANPSLPTSTTIFNLFYNLQTILKSTIYNLQNTDKIWLRSTNFAQKPKKHSTNLQDFGQKKCSLQGFF